jgi:hypothetical protein
MRAIPDSKIVGKRFGRLVGVRFDGVRDKKRHFIFRCDCGVEKSIKIALIMAGSTRSCGCLRAESMANRKTSLKHGEAAKRTPEYRSWRAMRTRCENPNHHAYSKYGGRGIKVCERWKDYPNFLADMGRRPTLDHSLDRIDPDGNYEPNNCRWATSKQQINNRREEFHHHIEWQGERLTLSEAADRVGISNALMRWRIENWTVEKAMTQPKRKMP